MLKFLEIQYWYENCCLKLCWTAPSALSIAQNAFSESAELSLYISFSQPYWLTHGVLNKRNSDYLDIFLENKSVLSLENKKYIHRIYQAFNLQSARGLYFAKSLADKNKRILESLPLDIRKYFVQSSNKEVFCMALATQSGNYGFPGFHNVIILEKLYKFYLERVGCQLQHKNGFYGFINKALPMLSSAEENLVIDYNRFSKYLNSIAEFGVYFVPFSDAKSFLDNLYIKKKIFIPTNSKFKKISIYLSKIPFFKSLNLNDQKIFEAVPKKIMLRITHPHFTCSEKRKWLGDFLEEKDWKSLSICSLSKKEFIKSFFMPNWVALVTQEKGKNEYF